MAGFIKEDSSIQVLSILNFEESMQFVPLTFHHRKHQNTILNLPNSESIQTQWALHRTIGRSPPVQK